MYLTIHVFFYSTKGTSTHPLLFISSIYLEPNLPEDSLLLKYPDDSNTEVSFTFNIRNIIKISSNRRGCNSTYNLYNTLSSDFPQGSTTGMNRAKEKEQP